MANICILGYDEIMKGSILLLLLTLGLGVFGTGSVSFKVYDSSLKATIELEENEHIAFIEDFLFLNIESDHYDFIFAGYPEVDRTLDSGFSYYDKKLTLEGDLLLKEGIEKGDYEIDVILGYQTCTDEGICHIPVEITRTVLVKSSSPLIPILLTGLLIVLVAIIIIRKRKNG